MDLSNIKDQVSNLSLYDLKAGVRKVQNGMWALQSLTTPCSVVWSQAIVSWSCVGTDRSAIAVMNYTEMESKVRIRPLPAQKNMSLNDARIQSWYT